jgi:hypothetical protein
VSTDGSQVDTLLTGLDFPFGIVVHNNPVSTSRATWGHLKTNLE